MADMVLVGIQYAVYLLEVCVLVCLFIRRNGRRLASVTSYLTLLFIIDVIVRQYVLHRYGLSSTQYSTWFWLTDVLLALAAFLLVCAFFRRACLREEEMWHYLRFLLPCVFLLVAVVSGRSLFHNFSHLYSRFIVEFGQNLYFTCLVLNTMLYILMQQIETADDELGLLVSGVGIQFAGPAASLALLHLTLGHASSKFLVQLIMPLCTLGMLLTWFYAVGRTRSVVEPSVGDLSQQVPANRSLVLAKEQIAVLKA